MTEPTKFPTLAMSLIHSPDLPEGTRYKCESPDWVVMKTTDDGETWEPIGRLDPPRHSQLEKIR